MRLLILAAALPIAAAGAQPLSLGEPQRPQLLGADKPCPTLLHDQDGRPEADMRKLGELPPADAFHAVYRLDEKGCIDPVMVGYQFGRRR